jgi:hypothetical protein
MSLQRSPPLALAVSSHRAIWCSSPLMRPISRSRVGSALGVGRRRRASTRPKASRIRSERLTPAWSALSSSAAFSTGVQRNTTAAPRPARRPPATPSRSAYGSARSAEEGFEGEACLPSQGSVSYDTGRLALIFSPAAITWHLDVRLGHRRRFGDLRDASIRDVLAPKTPCREASAPAGTSECRSQHRRRRGRSSSSVGTQDIICAALRRPAGHRQAASIRRRA